MIWLYWGSNGSGKSLHVAKDIKAALARGSLVMANFDINVETTKMHEKSRFIYFRNQEIKESPVPVIEAITEYFKECGVRHVLLVMDESHHVFDSRNWKAKGRKEWNAFCSEHRHYGKDKLDIIFITPGKRAVDKRIREAAEYEVGHRKIENCGTWGFWVAFLFGGNLFSYQVFSPGFKQQTESHFFRGNKELFNLYNTHAMFDS